MDAQHDVFISYATPDKATADTICHFLEAEGVRCWIAPRDIPAGGDWPEHIPAAIDASRLMVLVFSDSANASDFVQREVTLAANSKLPLIPFRVEEVPPKGGLRLHLVNTHWLDALTPPLAGHVRSLVRRVFEVLGAGPTDESIRQSNRNVLPELNQVEAPLPPPREKAIWYFAEGDHSVGPMSLVELVARVSAETEVWRQGMQGWLPAEQVPELFGKAFLSSSVPIERPQPPEVILRHKVPDHAVQEPIVTEAPAKPTTGNFFVPKSKGAANRNPNAAEPRAMSPAGTKSAAEKTRVFAGMEFCWCPPGKFTMGSPADEEEHSEDEGPLHEVTFSQGFWMEKYAVTQAQWRKEVGNAPSFFKGSERLPVENISWNDCQRFIKRLKGTGEGLFRLPSEAEWEYACRAGTITPFHFGETISTDQANYDGDYSYGPGKEGLCRGKTTPVGSFPANPWGLHDMHGNVWEWCQDWYHDSYTRAPAGGSAWKSPAGSSRVLRGGSWFDQPGFCRAAFRGSRDPDYRDERYGFRLLRTP